MKVTYLAFIFLVWTSQMMSVSVKEVTILIRQGTLIGFEELSERGDQFVAFRGIPYAQPPINDLRFKDPVPQDSWNKEIIADQFGSPCPQWDSGTSTVIGNEDCLTLNVFTPQVPVIMYETRTYPVMFWVHGGAFMKGSSSLYGPAKMMTQPVVLVTVNYRIGALGFLSTDDEAAPGNYGMMDLVLALKWVYDNVYYFGGDPHRITIFGESAGAAAVSHLVISPLTRGLFWAAITQSGSALCDWAVEEDPYSYTKLLSSSLGCRVEESSRSIVDCLRRRSATEIVTTQQKLLKYSFFPLRTAPIVDQGLRNEPFMPMNPETSLRNGNFSTVPLISGVVEHEGLLFALQILRHFAADIILHPNYFEDVILPQVLNDMTDQLYGSIKINQIKNTYFKHVDLTNMNEVIPPFVDLLSDILFFSCNDKMVKLHSRYAPVYMYLFTHRGNHTYAGPLIEEISKSFHSPLLASGVSHADELFYLFNLKNIDKSIWAEDHRIQEIFLYLWTTFAQQGTPNRMLMNQGPVTNFWNSLKEADLIFFNIDVIPFIARGFRQFEISIFDYINYSPATPERYVDSNHAYYVATWVLTTVCFGLLTICITLAVFLKRASLKRVYSTKHLDDYS